MTINGGDRVYCNDCARFYGYQAECPHCEARLETEGTLRQRLQLITYSRRASWILVGVLIGLLIMAWP